MMVDLSLNEALLEHDRWIRGVVCNTLRPYPSKKWKNDIDDIYQSARMAFVRCWIRYDPVNSDASLKTYAAYRIKGNVMDWFRRPTPGMISLEEEVEERGKIHAETPDYSVHFLEMQELNYYRGRLERWERNLLTLIYDEGETARDVAKMCGVTESRISQLRKGVLKRLRGFYDADGALNSRL